MGGIIQTGNGGRNAGSLLLGSLESMDRYMGQILTSSLALVNLFRNGKKKTWLFPGKITNKHIYFLNRSNKTKVILNFTLN